MSVRPLSGEELGQVYAELTLFRQRLLSYANVTEEEVQELLKTVMVANRAAWTMTYGDELGMEQINSEDGVEKAKKDVELFCILGNLVYNCVSNGGKCFLPEEQLKQITGIRLSIASAHFEQEEAEG